MTDHGNDEPEVDLWADTGRRPAEPPPEPPASSDQPFPPPTPGTEPTQVQPTTTGSDPDATAVLPAVASAATDSPPPGAPPPSPPDHDDGTPTGDDGSGRPTWLVPAAIVLLVVLGAALVVLLVTRDGGDGDTAISGSTVAPTTTATNETSAATSATTSGVEATGVAVTTIATDTTLPPATTNAAETTLAPETTTAAHDTVAPDTTVPPPSGTQPPPTVPEPIEPAEPGTVRVAGQSYPITRRCLTLPLAPDAADLQVNSYLFDLDGVPAIVEQWFDEGGVTGGSYREGRSGFDLDGDLIRLENGFALDVIDGDSIFQVVANPDGDREECARSNGVRTFPVDDPDQTYVHAVIDACVTTDDTQSRWIGYASDLGWFDVVDDGGGNTSITYEDPFATAGTDPDGGIVGDGADIGFRGVIDEVGVEIFLNDSFLRDCTDADLRDADL